MALVIPTKDSPNYSINITLDNVSYIMRFLYNTEIGFWTLGLNDVDDNPLLTNIKLVVNYPLTRIYKYLPIPPGEFYCLSSKKGVKTIGRDSFVNKEVSLIYLTEIEYEAVR